MIITQITRISVSTIQRWVFTVRLVKRILFSKRSLSTGKWKHTELIVTLYILKDFNYFWSIETVVDRNAKKERIRDWIQSSWLYPHQLCQASFFRRIRNKPKKWAFSELLPTVIFSWYWFEWQSGPIEINACVQTDGDQFKKINVFWIQYLFIAKVCT